MSTWSSQVSSLCDNGRELMHKDGLSSRSRTWNCSFDACLFLKLTWVCFHLKTSGFTFLDSRPKLPKHGRNFSLVFQVPKIWPSMSPVPCHTSGKGDIAHGCWAISSPTARTMSTGTPEPPRNPGGTGHWSQLPCGPCALGVDFGSYWKLVSYLSCLHIRSKNAEKSPVEWLIYFEYGLSICHLSNPHKPYFFTTEWKCKKK